MDFLSFIGSSELIVVAIIALVVFGPHRMPELARHFAKFSKLIRDASRELQRQLDTIDLDLDAPPKPKKSTAVAKQDENYSYPYGEEDESAPYNEMGEDAGYDGYPDNEDTYSSGSNDGNGKATAATETATQTAKSENRVVVDEDLKTQDAARFQRESID